MKCKDCDYFMGDRTFNTFCNYRSEPIDGDHDICNHFHEKEDEMIEIKKICFNCMHRDNKNKICKMNNEQVHAEDDACSYFKYKSEDQEAKLDAGKLQISLCPRQIIKDISEVRMYGTKKYGDPNNWKKVEAERYRDALMRHLLAYLDDPDSVDEESGIKHLKHIACNVAFLCEMEDKG